MENERILAYQMAQKLDEKDLNDVSGGGTPTCKWSGTPGDPVMRTPGDTGISCTSD